MRFDLVHIVFKKVLAALPQEDRRRASCANSPAGPPARLRAGHRDGKLRSSFYSPDGVHDAVHWHVVDIVSQSGSWTA
jgi:hypothetical protein